MIDAQLTTEIFGLLAPGNPDLALDIAYLPIRTVVAMVMRFSCLNSYGGHAFVSWTRVAW